VKELTINKTGGGQLFIYIPKTFERHFELKEGQKVVMDWDESDPEDPKLVIHLKPKRTVAQPVEHPKKKAVLEAEQR